MNSDDDRPLTPEDELKAREAGLDDTLEQTFPASDPASSIPNPIEPALIDGPEEPGGGKR
jgi:hypothetical protein